MGLLKKKNDNATGELELSADAGAAAAAPAPGETASAPALAASQPAEDGAVLAAEDGGEADAALAEATGAPEGGEPTAGGGDLLLNMFASSQVASDDRELLVQLAGDVEVVDLVDQARTLAAAMNIALAAD